MSIDEATRERIAGRALVLSVSGGKDSTAAGLWLMEQGMDFEPVHMATGWEHPDTDAYVAVTLPRVLGRPVRVLKPARDMAALIRHKRMFPSRLRRYCTEDLKVRPMAAYLATLNDPVNVLGIRADESQARAKLPEWEQWAAGDCDVWRPLLRWTVDDVIAIHRKHNVVPNPLYFKGAERVGCFPCIFARKEEVRKVAELMPERIDEIRALESEVTEARGESRTFFHGRAHLHGGDATIDQAVEWAQTDRGGSQLPLLRDEPDGCVRWGMCGV